MKSNKKTGQSAPAISLSYDQLNETERSVMGALYNIHTLTNGEPATLGALAEWAFPGNDRGNSWCRNGLRRLVRAGFASKGNGSGCYFLTVQGVRLMGKIAKGKKAA